MPSNKHNSRTAGDRDLIFSLIKVTLVIQRCAFSPTAAAVLASVSYLCTPLKKNLCTPLISHSFLHAQPRKVTICGRHGMASVRDIKIDEALLVLAFYVELDIAEIETLWLSRMRYGACVSRDAFSCCSLPPIYCCVTDKT